MLKKLPINARDMGSGGPNTLQEQLSLCATTMEPGLYSLGAAATEPMCPRACAP